MRVLELFSRTGSVGKYCKEQGWEVVSVEPKGDAIAAFMRCEAMIGEQPVSLYKRYVLHQDGVLLLVLARAGKQRLGEF